MKRDLKKERRALYAPPAKDFVVVDVPPIPMLMLDGQGDPNASPAYAAAVEALFSVSYTLKFAIRKSGGDDYGVMPLEGLWWADDYSAFTAARRDEWKWTMMIAQPDFVSQNDVAAAIAEAARKKPDLPASALRFDIFHEGLSVQILHVGPFSAEGPTLDRLHHEYIPQHGLALRGKHHEIYLSDVRKAAPEKWRTILRQPVERVG